MSFMVFEKYFDEAEDLYSDYLKEAEPPHLSFQEFLRKYYPELIKDNNFFGEE